MNQRYRHLYFIITASILGLFAVGYFFISLLLSPPSKPQEIFSNMENNINNGVGTSTEKAPNAQQEFSQNFIPDMSTNVLPTQPSQLNTFFTKDKNHVYFNGKLFDADPETFQMVGGSYAKDRNAVYAITGEYDGSPPGTLLFLEQPDAISLTKVADIDPGTFEIIPDSKGINYSEFSKDSSGVYFQLRKIPNTDPQTFSYLGADRYFKDKNYIYYEQSDTKDGFSRWVVPIDGSDPSTARVVETESMVIDDPDAYHVPQHHSLQKVSFVRDKNVAYYEEMRVIGVNPDSFDLGDFADHYRENPYGYFIYKENVYFVNTQASMLSRVLMQVKNTDVVTFTMLINSYAKDKNYVYYRGEVMPSADPTVFTVLSSSGYAKDLKHAYWGGSSLTEANAITFEVLKFGNSNESLYAKDKDHIFYEDHIIRGADSSTFTIIDPVLGYYAKDKDHVFYGETIVEGADTPTFSMLTFFSKDKNHVYFGGKILSTADPKTFQEIENSPMGINGYNNYDALDKTLRYKINHADWSVKETPR